MIIMISCWWQSWHYDNLSLQCCTLVSLRARFMGSTWGPSGADRTQVGLMLAPWNLLSGMLLTLTFSKLHIQNILRIMHSCAFLWFDGFWLQFILTNIFQDYFPSTGRIIQMPHCQISNPREYGNIINASLVKKNVNYLRLSDAIWWHRIRSTLDQVMACRLAAPSHYLDQF